MIFPVKFPVGREFKWRRARCALRRQPGIPALGRAFQETRNKAGNAGFFAHSTSSPGSQLAALVLELPKVSGYVREYSRFAETFGGD